MFCTHGARPAAGHLHQAVWRGRPGEDRGRSAGHRRSDRGRPTTTGSLRLPDRGAVGRARRGGAVARARRQPRCGHRGGSAHRQLPGRGQLEPPRGVALATLDGMLMLTVEGGHLPAMRRLLDAGARVDGDPDSEEIPLGHACWSRRVDMTRELVGRGIALAFRDGSTRSAPRCTATGTATTPRAAPRCAPSTRSPRSPTRIRADPPRRRRAHPWADRRRSHPRGGPHRRTRHRPAGLSSRRVVYDWQHDTQADP